MVDAFELALKKHNELYAMIPNTFGKSEAMSSSIQNLARQMFDSMDTGSCVTYLNGGGITVDGFITAYPNTVFPDGAGEYTIYHAIPYKDAERGLALLADALTLAQYKQCGGTEFKSEEELRNAIQFSLNIRGV